MKSLPISAHVGLAIAVLASALALTAQQPNRQPTTAEQAPTRDTSYIDAQGTAHVTRVVPVPQDLSPEAQRFISRQVPDEAPPQSLAERRASQDANEQRHKAEWSKLCPNTIVETQIAGVPVHIVTPDGMPAANNDKVLINLHGGSFNADSGSYAESIPIAGYSKMKVVAVLYRLAPEHQHPAALDDALSACREIASTHGAIALSGDSAGGGLAAATALRLAGTDAAPTRLGLIAPWVDLTVVPPANKGDIVVRPAWGLASAKAYCGDQDRFDPGISPIFAKAWMNFADRAASTMSQASAMFAPAPAATPLTAQMTGFSSDRISRSVGL